MLENMMEKYGASYKFKIAIRSLALLVIAGLYAAAYFSESASGDTVGIKFKEGYNMLVSKTTGDGFHFRIENLSQTDLNSIKMTINNDYSYIPRMTIYRDGYADFETSSFKNPSGEKFVIGRGQNASLFLECVTARGKTLTKTTVIKYEK
ncbi:MAG TPA: hypothetical protein PKK26_14705 [Candidatus Wallbacteria bacterium]|nr:hypothetical protein [Candidatus Wallbacteria bacterium]